MIFANRSLSMLATTFCLFFLAGCSPTSTVVSHEDLLTVDTPPSTPGLIEVGENVRVSTDERHAHVEGHLTADPEDSNRLAACSIMEAGPGGGTLGSWNTNTVLHVSYDRGRTWIKSVEELGAWDPACQFGRGSALYFGTGKRGRPGEKNSVRVHRSPDGGKTWLSSTEIRSGFEDKPWIAVDTRSTSAFVDRLYLAFRASGPSDALVWSGDKGASFSPPVTDTTFASGGADDGVVLSDGTLVVLSGPTKIGVLVSSDGGRSVNPHLVVPPPGSVSGTVPRMAVDASDGPFRDRIYVAWSAIHDGRLQVHVSYSADKGGSWSLPRIANDDRAWLSEDAGPDAVMPTLAVNHHGVVGLIWYDRRDNPDNLGYFVRFSASLDGGDTWLPSVRVSEVPHAHQDPLASRVPIGLSPAGMQTQDAENETVRIQMSRTVWVTNGHFAGLAADKGGVFHPLWVDNRTGVEQLWTAPIRVRGSSARDPVLAELRPITNQVEIKFNGFAYRRTGPSTAEITGKVIFTNTSAHTLQGPFRLRVIRGALTKWSAPTLPAAARVHLDPTHANWMSVEAWNLSNEGTGGVQALTPGTASSPIPIRFQLDDFVVDPELRKSGSEGIYDRPNLELLIQVFGNG